MKYHTLLFDVDNTILDFDANEAESFRKMVRDLGVTYSEEMFQRYHTINRGIWEQIEKGEIDIQSGCCKRFEILMGEYGKTVNGEVWEKTYRSHLNEGVQKMPHVNSVLERLKNDFRLYVITNGVKETQYKRMRGSGLDVYFERMFISEEIGSSKPSKEFFDYVKTHISDFQPETALVIGDSLTSDIQGGICAGLDTCWITRKRGIESAEWKPNYVIHDLSELIPILYGR